MGKKILVVDDEREIVEFLSSFLRRREVSVYISTSGKDALTVFSQRKPDVVFLDVNLGDIDGFSILEKMKKMDENAKVIMITAKGDKVSITKAKKLGAMDYLVKPLDLEELYSKLSLYLK